MGGQIKHKIDGQTVFAAIALAVGILFYWWMFYSAGYSSGRHEERAHVQRQHYASDAAERLSKHCAELTGADLRECAYKIVRSERESQREESDLAAQWEMADWAFWVFVIAGTQLFATIVGLILIKGTLDATWKAVEDTSEATDAMRELNRLTEVAQHHASVTARAQLRTYFSSEKELYTQDDTGRKIELGYEYKNVGLTPAHNVTVVLLIRFVTRGKPHSLKSRTVDQRVLPYGMMGPGAKTHVPFTFRITEAEAKAMESAAAILSVLVTINYKDEFGDSWLFTQEMMADSFSRESGLMYTLSCSTNPVTAKQRQEQEEELPLEGGGDGREEEAEHS